MAAILHVDGEQYLADLFAGADYEAGLGNWEPAISDTFATTLNEPSGNGYTRRQLVSANGDLTVDVMPAGDGYRVSFMVAFTANGGDFPRVKQIFIGNGTDLIFSIPITADMVDPDAGLTWSDSDGLLIPDGCTFQPLAPLFICNRNTAPAGQTTAPKPAYNTPLDPANPINDRLVFCSWMVPDADGQECVTLTDVSGNELHGTLNNLDPLAPVVVTGASNSNYNGNYLPVNSGQYNHESRNLMLFKLYEFMGGGWCLMVQGQDPMMDGYAYWQTPASTNPWQGTWNGPTVTQGSAAAGPWTDDGLQFNGQGFVDLSASSILNPQVELPPVIVSGSSHSFLNQNYHKVAASQWNSADGLYKIQQAFMQWPPAWEICTMDYDPMAPAGTSYHSSSQSDPLPSPWAIAWTGVSLALGTVTYGPDDPTGMTIHVLVKVKTVAGDHHLVSRWGSSGAADSYVLQRYNSLARGYVYNNIAANDVVPPVTGQIVALTFVWDGAHFRLYRDGVQVCVDVALDTIPSSSSKTALGSYIGAGSSALGSLADDEIRLVQIWKRGLSAAEVWTKALNPYGNALGS